MKWGQRGPDHTWAGTVRYGTPRAGPRRAQEGATLLPAGHTAPCEPGVLACCWTACTSSAIRPSDSRSSATLLMSFSRDSLAFRSCKAKAVTAKTLRVIQRRRRAKEVQTIV